MAINLINPSMLGSVQSAVSGQKNSGFNNRINLSEPAGSGSFSDVLEAITKNNNASTVFINEASSEEKTSVNLDELFLKASETYQVPVNLLKAVAKAESNFDPNAESHAGAKGIMQLMPATAESLGVQDPFDPEQNIMGGAKYLSQQLARYEGNTVLALAAYNAGPGNVAKYDGVPPFEETRNYISKVMAYAGEPVTAGETILSARSEERNGENLIQQMGSVLFNSDSNEMDAKDYAFLMDLYRYQMQLNILSDSDSDSDSDFGLINFPGSFI